MPHFNELGHDTYICQFCGQIKDGQLDLSVWVEGRGNKCSTCNFEDQSKKPLEPPISLYEHCRRESGLEGQALTNYINRHYGHG